MFNIQKIINNENYTLSILYLGKEARLNTPGTLDTLNWTYRYLQHDIFNDNIKKYLFNLNKTYKRLNYKNFKE